MNGKPTIFNHIFKTENVILLVISLAMLNNVEHLAYVHHSIARLSFHVPWLDKLHSIVVVLIIEVVIIALAHYGKHGFAGFYSFMLFCLQLIYYPLDTYIQNQQYGRFIAAIIYSGMFTVSIYYFAVLAYEKAEEKKKAQRLTQTDSGKTIDELKRINSELTSKQNESNRIIDELKQKVSESNSIAESLLRNHILYEAWMSKKRSESNRNGFDKHVNDLAERLKQGDTIKLSEYLKHNKQPV